MSTIWNPWGNSQNYNPIITMSVPTHLSAQLINFTTAFTFGTAGFSTVFYFVSPATADLTDFWFKVNGYTGTWASTDGVINVEIREGLNGANKPGSTLTGSFTVTLDGTTTGWTRKTGLSIALTAGRMYAIVVGDADGNATNYCTLRTREFSGVGGALSFGNSATSTDGFATAGTANNGCSCVGVKIGDVILSSGGFVTVSTLASNTNARGNRFRPNVDCTLIGASCGYDSTNVLLSASGIHKLYADSASPSDTPLMEWTNPGTTLNAGTAPAPSHIAHPSSSWYDLKAGTWYRFVRKPPSASTVPRKGTITHSPDTTLKPQLLPFNGDCYHTEENGTGWTDDVDGQSAFGMVLVPTTPSGGITEFVEVGMA